jgi:hypothetical protein
VQRAREAGRQARPGAVDLPLGLEVGQEVVAALHAGVRRVERRGGEADLLAELLDGVEICAGRHQRGGRHRPRHALAEERAVDERRDAGHRGQQDRHGDTGAARGGAAPARFAGSLGAALL